MPRILKNINPVQAPARVNTDLVPPPPDLVREDRGMSTQIHLAMDDKACINCKKYRGVVRAAGFCSRLKVAVAAAETCRRHDDKRRTSQPRELRASDIAPLTDEEMATLFNPPSDEPPMVPEPRRRGGIQPRRLSEAFAAALDAIENAAEQRSERAQAFIRGLSRNCATCAYGSLVQGALRFDRRSGETELLYDCDNDLTGQTRNPASFVCGSFVRNGNQA